MWFHGSVCVLGKERWKGIRLNLDRRRERVYRLDGRGMFIDFPILFFPAATGKFAKPKKPYARLCKFGGKLLPFPLEKKCAGSDFS